MSKNDIWTPYRLMEIQHREANVHLPSAFPGGEGPTQPHPQWGGETTRQQTYLTTNATYHQGQRQSPSGKAGHHVLTYEWTSKDYGFAAIEYTKGYGIIVLG